MNFQTDARVSYKGGSATTVSVVDAAAAAEIETGDNDDDEDDDKGSADIEMMFVL